MQLVLNGNLPILNYRTAYRQAQQRGMPTGFWRGKCNQFRSTVGPLYGRGWFLMQKRHADQITTTATFHTLTLRDGLGTQIQLKKLSCARAYLVMPTAPTPRPDDVYMVELVDLRHTGQAAFWSNPVNKAYNVRAPAAAQDYYADSLNGGAAWTWQQVLDNLWGLLPASMGAAPQLPANTAPASNPEGLRFHGVSAWAAWNEVLSKVGCACAVDHFIDGLIRIIQVGDQTGVGAFDAARQRWGKRLVWLTDVKEPNWAKVPATVRVYFHKQTFDQYGSEKTTNWAAGNQWSMDAVHSADETAVNVAAAGVIPVAATTNLEPGSIAFLWDDLPAITDFAGAVTNGAACTARATERAKDFYRAAFSGQKVFHDVYSGVVEDNNLTRIGSLVTGVAWLEQGRGLATEVLRLPRHLWPAVLQMEELEKWLTWDAKPKTGLGVAMFERLAPPDFGRQTQPIYPPLSHCVEITSSTATDTDVYPGRVIRVNSSLSPPGDTIAEDCYVYSFSGARLKNGDLIAGARLVGAFDKAGAVAKRPLYATSQGVGGDWAKALTDTPTAGEYNARLQVRLADGTLSDTGPSIWLRDANNTPALISGELYECSYTGFNNARAVYTCCDFNATVRKEDLSFSQDRTLYFEFGPNEKVTITRPDPRRTLIQYAGLDIVDLSTGTTYVDVWVLQFDSTPTPWNGVERQDYVFTWDDVTHTLTVRLNGRTADDDFVYTCSGGALRKWALKFRNGLCKDKINEGPA